MLLVKLINTNPHIARLSILLRIPIIPTKTHHGYKDRVKQY